MQRPIDEDTCCIDVLNQVAAATQALQSVAVGRPYEHVRDSVPGRWGFSTGSVADTDHPARYCCPPSIEPGCNEPW
ncbi:MAG: metal-sensing transcriptional repressor [Euzebyaceae bacterium]|nr:metal-sensing transcriptional repressor [Euzebyaceae bacterium]